MGKDDREKTPPTGTAIPRPRLRPVTDYIPFADVPEPPIVDFEKLPKQPSSAPPPSRPDNPTLDDIYKLIDERLSMKIVERISSAPPAAAAAPRQSLPVRVAKGTGRWTKWAMAALGVLTIVGEIWADVEKYRGPISQLLVFAAKQMDAHEAPELAPPTAEPE